MVKCCKGCVPCCDFCVYAEHEELWIDDTHIGRGEPTHCTLHPDGLCESSFYCDDFHCFRVKEK